MSQPSSFTSSSERTLTPARAALAVVWTLVGLALIDAMVNVAFAYPADPKIAQVGQIPAYFEYGRSIEGKLARITRPDPRQTAPITLAGWYEPLKAESVGGPRGAPSVTFYGMSHSVQMAQALARTSHEYQSRSIGAPGATANWSFGAFLRDRDRGKSKVAVLSIMSLTAPMVSTMTAITWNSAFPLPYTEERFELVHGRLRTVAPPYDSFAGYARAFYDPRAWARARAQFAAHDSYYNGLMFRASFFDHSAVFRLMRRAYGLHLERESAARVLSPTAFDPNSEEIQILNAIVRAFANQARKDRIVPVIFVINNYGYGTQLYQALQPGLRQCDVPYLSSHTVVSPSDPRSYLPDTHFTEPMNDRLSIALERVIDAALARGEPMRKVPPSCAETPTAQVQTAARGPLRVPAMDGRGSKH